MTKIVGDSVYVIDKNKIKDGYNKTANYSLKKFIQIVNFYGFIFLLMTH